VARVKTGGKFLAASVLGAVNTANGYRALSDDGLGLLPAWIAGTLTEELPLQAIGWQAMAAAAFARRGALRESSGKLGLAVSAVSWAGLAGLYREAYRSDKVLERALVDELGTEYRRRMAPVLAPPTEAPITVRQAAMPLRRGWRRYRSTRNVAYGDYGRRNLLDVWRRADLARDAKAPVLIQVPGGAWVTGRKEGQAYPLLAHLAERGWVCVAINYRLSPRATWPDHIVDVKRAIGWVKANIADHGGDPDFVAITGGSAGGHLSALAALSINDPLFQPGFEDTDTIVQAAVPFYGVYDFTNRDGTGRADLADLLAKKVMKSALLDDRDRWDAASPVSRVRADAPPFFIVHGSNDTLVPVQQGRAFAAALSKESTNPVVFGELPRAQHAFDTFGSVRTLHTVRAVERFLAVVYGDTHGGEGPDLAGLATSKP
jgi:acetyl esterase/lipase